MSRVAYVNGRYRPVAEASVSVDDRAFTFGDGVYDVCEVRGGALIDETRHLARLRRSLEGRADLLADPRGGATLGHAGDGAPQSCA